MMIKVKYDCKFYEEESTFIYVLKRTGDGGSLVTILKEESLGEAI